MGGVKKTAIARPALGAFAGALFLVHPLQTESVAYVASRSEVLSTLFYYGAYCVFLYRRTESITWVRALAVLALFGGAVLIQTNRHHIAVAAGVHRCVLGEGRPSRQPPALPGPMALGGVAGAVFVWKTLRTADNTVLHVQGMTPFTYFLTAEPRPMDLRAAVLPARSDKTPILKSPCLTDLFDQGAIIAVAGMAGGRRRGVDLSQALAARFVRPGRVPFADRADVLR